MWMCKKCGRTEDDTRFVVFCFDENGENLYEDEATSLEDIKSIIHSARNLSKVVTAVYKEREPCSECATVPFAA